jgi:hypothetical protein
MPHSRPPIKSLPRRRFLLSGAVLLGGLLTADVTLRQPQALQIEKHILPLAKMPEGKEIRLIQLSDLHLRTSQGYFEQVAHMVSTLRPDVILLTGDYLEQSRNLEGVLKFLRLLHAPAGIFAVQGNWEYWARLEGENLRRQFRRADVSLLISERRDLQVHGVPLSILGVDYPSPADQVSRLVKGASLDRVNLMLSHVPAFNHQLLDKRIDLVLAGHTHGGQVRLPLLPPLYLPRFSGSFVAGFYPAGLAKVPLYVNRGLGTSLLPVRFMCSPEITLFRLVSRLPAHAASHDSPAKTPALSSTAKNSACQDSVLRHTKPDPDRGGPRSSAHARLPQDLPVT